MKERGQGLVALVLATLVLGGGAAAARVGTAAPPAAATPTARSSEWLCPHGGGEGWTAVVVVANPGGNPVQARVTSLGPDAKPGEPSTFTVPPGSELWHEVPAEQPASATYVEVFGGWASTSWLVRAADTEIGVGAEPCAPAGAPRWITTESTTQEGETAFLIVMNPYATGAVFDVVLYQPDEPPLRDPDWSDLELRAGRAMALRIHAKVVGNETVAAVVDAQSGRVAVATLGVTQGGGVRSVLGATGQATTWSMGTRWGSGQSQVLLFAPGEEAVRFGATLRSLRAPQSAGGLIDVRQSSLSTQAYPVIADGPSLVELHASGDALVVAAIRSQGQSGDDGATGGLITPAVAWIVPPTSAEDPAFSGVIVANPGEEPVVATLRLIGVSGPGESFTVTIPAGGTANVDDMFLTADPRASILVLADGPVVAVGASTSGGPSGLSLYAIAAGLPIPEWAVPTG